MTAPDHPAPFFERKTDVFYTEANVGDSGWHCVCHGHTTMMEALECHDGMIKAVTDGEVRYVVPQGIVLPGKIQARFRIVKQHRHEIQYIMEAETSHDMKI